MHSVETLSAFCLSAVQPMLSLASSGSRVYLIVVLVMLKQTFNKYKTCNQLLRYVLPFVFVQPWCVSFSPFQVLTQNLPLKNFFNDCPNIDSVWITILEQNQYLKWQGSQSRCVIYCSCLAISTVLLLSYRTVFTIFS